MSISNIILFVLMAAVAVVMVLGLVNMLRPNADKKKANKLMSMRVGFQAAALVVLAIIMLVDK